MVSFSLPLYQNRKEKEDGATVRVSDLPIPAARQSGEPAQSSRAPFAWPLLNNIHVILIIFNLSFSFKPSLLPFEGGLLGVLSRH